MAPAEPHQLLPELLDLLARQPRGRAQQQFLAHASRNKPTMPSADAGSGSSVVPVAPSAAAIAPVKLTTSHSDNGNILNSRRILRQ
ncbi:hypothetical protein ACFVZJ_22240 [Streptomyces sp. NPDC058322]|uniref:hypothetical protein n=1 Tax=Streptomyces sp. NPDC058322 TaxID=3346446 RepID=UPI0036E497B1